MAKKEVMRNHISDFISLHIWNVWLANASHKAQSQGWKGTSCPPWNHSGGLGGCYCCCGPVTPPPTLTMCLNAFPGTLHGLWIPMSVCVSATHAAESQEGTPPYWSMAAECFSILVEEETKTTLWMFPTYVRSRQRRPPCSLDVSAKM